MPPVPGDLDQNHVSAYIPNPYLEPRTLLFALAEELRVALPRDADQHQLLKELTRGLLNFARQGKTVVLCLDEAQAMPIETLEALRLLTNLETEKRKLLQVVLFGQPELDQKLEGESVRQLRQRITFQYRLTALGRDEVDQYLAHRLRVAGYRGNRLFTRPAARLVHRWSGGVPRLDQHHRAQGDAARLRRRRAAGAARARAPGRGGHARRAAAPAVVVVRLRACCCCRPAASAGCCSVSGEQVA